MNLDDKLSEKDQEYLLKELLGIVINDGVLVDDHGNEFFNDHDEDGIDLNTLRGIIDFLLFRKRLEAGAKARYKMVAKVTSALIDFEND